MLKGRGVGACSAMQCTNSPCRQPADMSQSVEASAISMRAMTMSPQMKAITLSGRVMVTVSMVVMGAAMVKQEGRLDLKFFNYFLAGLKIGLSMTAVSQ